MSRKPPFWFCLILGGAWNLGCAGALPDLAFAGPYGATDGAGAIVGWDRNGMDVNPAAYDPRHFGLAAAEYSPFDLPGVNVGEVEAAADAAAWGAGLAYRAAAFGSDGYAQAVQLQSAVGLRRFGAAGVSLRAQSDAWDPHPLFNLSAGLLWKPLRSVTAGITTQSRYGQGRLETQAGFGAGCTWTPWRQFPGGRAALEAGFDPMRGWSARVGAALRLHARLMLYAGWSPALWTWALGVAFQIGDWQGFHALRRHSVLGATNLEGLRMERPWRP